MTEPNVIWRYRNLTITEADVGIAAKFLLSIVTEREDDVSVQCRASAAIGAAELLKFIVPHKKVNRLHRAD